MNVRTWSLASAALATLLAVPALRAQMVTDAAPSTMPSAATSQPVDVSSIAGDYVVVTASREGTDVPAAMLASMRVKVGDGKVTMMMGGRGDDAVVSAMDPKATPATIDLMAPGGNGPKLAGIYKLEGDKLSLLFRRDGVRPSDFNPAPGVMLLVLDRGKQAGATSQPVDATIRGAIRP